MFAKDTLEDPTNRIERDGFLDEIERISEATGVFDSTKFEALDAFLAGAGPDGRPRTRAPRARRVAPSTRVPTSRSRTRSWPSRTVTTSIDARIARAPAARSRCLPKPADATPRYLELELANLPARRQAEGRAEAAVDGRGARSRSRGSATGGASAAPAAARRHRSCSSAGRRSTRPSPAAATESALRAGSPLGSRPCALRSLCTSTRRPSKVWALVSDITKMGEYSPEVVEAEWLDGATGPAVGARYRGHVKRNENWPVLYWTTCKITECVPGRGLRVRGHHARPAGEHLALRVSCRPATEAPTSPSRSISATTSSPRSGARSEGSSASAATERDMLRTLERVKAVAETSSNPAGDIAPH